MEKAEASVHKAKMSDPWDVHFHPSENPWNPWGEVGVVSRDLSIQVKPSTT